jgi:hypothetical protein
MGVIRYQLPLSLASVLGSLSKSSFGGGYSGAKHPNAQHTTTTYTDRKRREANLKDQNSGFDIDLEKGR